MTWSCVRPECRKADIDDDALGRVYRSEWPHLLGRLVAWSGRIDLAEDALADAFSAAAGTWGDSPPTNPPGWLFRAARRRIVDAIRHEQMARGRQHLIATPDVQPAEVTSPDAVDDRLQLLWLATHPALAPEIRPALALRVVLGVPTAQIARLFLVPDATMAARLTRSKRRISKAGLRFDLEPDDTAWRDRDDDVARSLMLAFTAAYLGGAAASDLADDTAGLTVLAADTVPGSAALAALAALVRLQHARRHARHQPDGTLVTLAAQDRSRWVRAEIVDGLRRFAAVEPTQGFAEELRLMACVAALHAVAPNAPSTDWQRIDAVYERLEQLTGSPVVRLNRAATRALAGDGAGITLLDDLDPILQHHHRVAVVRAELLYSAGDLRGARAALDAALDQCPLGPERDHIVRRRAELDALPGPSTR